MPTASVIGARLRELREERGWTVAELARESGVDRNSISQVEQGASKAPSFPNGVRLARALNVSVDYLAGLANERSEYATLSPAAGAPPDLVEMMEDTAQALEGQNEAISTILSALVTGKLLNESDRARLLQRLRRAQ